MERCREVIVQAAKACPGRGLAMVCGSGHLYDVPLEELAGMFGKVVLVDAVHPWRARRLARKYGDVRLVEADLTGLLGEASGWRKGIDARGIVPAAPTELTERAPDLTVSANVLSQLALPVKKRLERLGCPEDAVLEVCRRITTAHLDWLWGLAGMRCLITDTVSRDVDGGTVLEETDLLYGVEVPQGGEEWTWRLAPRPEAGRGFDRIRRVIACCRHTTLEISPGGPEAMRREFA
ncbi:MAG: hypothetical protein ACOY4F_12135 [Thermodesulfobacteriota bacterium]